MPKPKAEDVMETWIIAAFLGWLFGAATGVFITLRVVNSKAGLS